MSYGDYYLRIFYKKNSIIKIIRMYFNIDKSNNIIYTNIIELVNKDKYSVDYYPKDSDITFIVFNKDGTNKDAVPFALFFLLKLGFNVIAIKQDNDKYQSLSFTKFKEVVSPLVKEKKVFLYGMVSSL